MDPFEILGVPRGFQLDDAALALRHRELTRLLHPDRHAGGGAAERRHALEKMIQVNDAFRILRDPVRRAAWLLSQQGISLEGSEGVDRYLPPSFLLEVMEQREELAEARAAKQLPKVKALGAAIQASRDRALAELAAAFEASDSSRAAAALAQLRYHARFLEEVSAFEDEEFEGRHV